MKTWTCKVELMTGTVTTIKVRAATASDACTALATGGPRIGNIISVKDSRGVQHV